MIDINKLKSRQALNLIVDYEGKNPYLKKIKRDYIKTKRNVLTETQIRYIVEYFDKEPELINKVVRISPLLGEDLQKQHDLNFIPEKILIEFMLADTEKSFHIVGKLSTKQESKMYWLPKSLVFDDPYFNIIDVDVDFTKYDEIFAKKGWNILPHQKEGVKFLLTRNGCILADDMGLGKTAISIMAALESGAERILIVCPSSVKTNWEREINMFDDQTYIVEGRKWGRSKFTIINYDILKNFHTVGNGKTDPDEPVIELSREMVNSRFDLVIIDEAHNLKNKNSNRGEIMSELCVKYGIEKVWLLTGTPVANRPMDFYNLLKLIKSPLTDNWKYYVKRYCEGREITKTLKNGRKKKIWLTNGASNLDELSIKTRNLILRRLKTEVLDMPEKTVTNVYHKLSDRSLKEYHNLWEEYLLERKKAKKRGSVEREMVELGLLRKFIAMEAIPQTIEMARNAIEQGDKVVIFASFTDELKELEEEFGNECVVHYGGMSITDKQYSVDAFQNNPKIKVFIGNMISASVGITLTSGNTTIFNSFSWVPGINDQAEDRTWRLGQKNNCKIFYQLFLDTVSVKMLNTLNNKKDIINAIIGDKNDKEVLELVMDLVLDEEND